MREWFKTDELANRTKIPESTIRRYIKKYHSFFTDKEKTLENGVKKYSPDIEPILLKIRRYTAQEKLSTDEIKERLQEEFPQIIDIEDKQEQEYGVATTSPPQNQVYIPMLIGYLAKVSDQLTQVEEKLSKLEVGQGQLQDQLQQNKEETNQTLSSFQKGYQKTQDKLSYLEENQKALSESQHAKLETAVTSLEDKVTGKIETELNQLREGQKKSFEEVLNKFRIQQQLLREELQSIEREKNKKGWLRKFFPWL